MRRVAVHTPTMERGARIRTMVMGVGMTLILVLTTGVGGSFGGLVGVFAFLRMLREPSKRLVA